VEKKLSIYLLRISLICAFRIFFSLPNVDRRTLFGSEKKMRSAHISEMRSKADFHSVEKVARSTFCEIQAIKRNG
jgi:hypothetical protein